MYRIIELNIREMVLKHSDLELRFEGKHAMDEFLITVLLGYVFALHGKHNSR